MHFFLSGQIAWCLTRLVVWTTTTDEELGRFVLLHAGTLLGVVCLASIPPVSLAIGGVQALLFRLEKIDCHL